MEEFAERYRAQNDVESIEREYDEMLVNPVQPKATFDGVAMTQEAYAALTARLTVLADALRGLLAAVDTSPGAAATADAVNAACAALGAERA